MNLTFSATRIIIGHKNTLKSNVEYDIVGLDGVSFSRIDNGQLIVGPISYYDLINPDTGVAFTSLVALTDLLTANFLNAASFGPTGGGTTLKELTTLVWDGSNVEIVVTADTNIMTAPYPFIGGTLLVQQGTGGGFTVSLNGTSIAVGSLDEDTIVVYTLLQRTDGTLFVIPNEAGIAVAAPDITIPAPVSFVITSAANILNITFTENLDTTSIPTVSDFISMLGKTISSITIATDVLTLHMASNYVHGAVEKITYTPGTHRIMDLSGNNVVAFNSGDYGGVTNNVA